MSSTLPPLPTDLPVFLTPYLPPSPSPDNHNRWVTLTYAQSLDGRIAAARGTRTTLSHPQTKTMTHYIRSKHSAILVGVDTVLADDPSLNCRYGDDPSTTAIRPVIIDPHYRLKDHIPKLKVVINYKSGISLKPLIIVSSLITDTSNDDVDLLKVQPDPISNYYLPWDNIFNALSNISLNTIMVEGGATIINRLLTSPHLVNSIIITIAPLYLGDNAVPVSPTSKVTLGNISWWSGIQDSVLAANPTI
ncbi:hypothetical protein CANINC_003513 [Pichia inconspicua]|uniref:2,5-diamino-6-ribosylamino-4(3H)-pyrimidinone 5'-phosphate reductase n=1 Tax=Pichia inconspicua TaxID=52247 RepID=A0A4T0X009_9ASCO|nr:hypothetical protein CANINC_003513 [[Candida] inconspicua]